MRITKTSLCVLKITELLIFRLSVLKNRTIDRSTVLYFKNNKMVKYKK